MSAELWLGLCLQVATAVPSVPGFAPAIDPIPAEPEAVAAQPEEAASKAPPEAVVLTVEGQSMAGTLCPAVDGRIGLASSDFAAPLVIRPDRLAAITFDIGEDDRDGSQGYFEVALNDGSRLHAKLLGVTAEGWRLSASGMGTFTVPASSIVGVENLGSGEDEPPGLIYRGPTGLAGWGQGPAQSSWVVEPGRIVAKKANTRLSRDLSLDEPREVTVRLRWKGDPHFRLLIGAKTASSKKDLLTLEPWGDTLVASWTQKKKSMEFTEIMEGLEADSSLELKINTLDESIMFLDIDGVELGRIPRVGQVGPRLNIISDSAGLELSGIEVVPATGDDVGLRRLSAGEITGVEADGQRFVTATETVDKAVLLGIDIEGSAPPVSKQAGDLWLEYADGRRVGGAFQAVTETGLLIKPAWAAEPITAEWDSLAKAVVYGSEEQTKRRRSSKSFLVTAKGEVAGELESISPNGEIVWAPSIAEGSTTLSMDSVQRVVINRTTAYFVSGRKFPHLMRLRDGDTFRCVVHSITDDDILYSSPFGKSRKVEASLVKAVEFDLRATARFARIFAEKPKSENNWYSAPKEARRETSEGFDKDSLERALALPRKYKGRQFEHLVLARNGDFLRTSLVGLSPEGAVYPGASDVDRLVPKNRLAAVIWLDPPKVEAVVEAGSEAGAKPEQPKTNARVVMDENTSLSMKLSGTRDGKLIGSSPILGDVEIELPHIVSIDLDPETVHTHSVYHEWVLKPMKEPFPDDAGAAAPSAESPAESPAESSAEPSAEEAAPEAKPATKADDAK